MSEKLTKEMIDALIKEELAKSEQERLDEFKVQITNDELKKIGDIRTKLGLPSTNPSGQDTAQQKAIVKKIRDRDKSPTNQIDDKDVQNLKNDPNRSASEIDWVNWAIDNTTSSDLKKDWDNIIKGGGGTYPAASTLTSASMLYKAIEKAVIDYNNDSNNRAASDALTDYLARFVQQQYKGKTKTTIAGQNKGITWGDLITAVQGGGTVSGSLLKIALDDIKNSLGEYDPQDISRPEMATVGAEKAQFSKDAIYAFDGLFKSKAADTIEKRIAAINELSKAMVEGGGSNTIDKIFNSGQSGDNKRNFLNGIVCMDYIAKFAKEIDHGAGAYFFEAFSALISGGGVKGKDNKAGDFTLAAKVGERSGSSKYLAGHKSSQAVGGFKLNTPVLYFAAHKKAKGGGGISAPDEIVAIDIYTFEVNFTNIDRNTAANNQATVSNNVAFSFGLKGRKAQIYFDTSGATPEGTIYLATRKDQSFRDALEDQVDKSNQQIKDSYELMKTYFAQTRKADVQVKSYMGSGDVTEGTQALRAITAADEQMVEMFNLLRQGTTSTAGVTGSRGARELKENKMEQLDLMIENMVKQFIKGNLND